METNAMCYLKHEASLVGKLFFILYLVIFLFSPSFSKADDSNVNYGKKKVTHNKIKTAKSQYRLSKDLFSKNPKVRIMAIRQAVKNGETKAMGKLASMARKDLNVEVRQTAAWAIGEMDLKMRKAVLASIIHRDNSVKVKQEAQFALDTLNKKYSNNNNEQTNSRSIRKSKVNESSAEMSLFAKNESGAKPGACQKDTDCKGVRICTAPPHYSAGWARGAGAFGLVGTAIVGGLELSSAISKDRLVPAVPLAASGTVFTIITATIVSVGSRSARSSDDIKGSLGLRLLGWLSFGFHLTGSLSLAAAIPFHWIKEDAEGNNWVPPTSWIVINGSLAVTALLALSVDSFVSANQASNLRKKSFRNNSISLKMAPFVAPNYSAHGESNGAVAGLMGRF